MKERVLNSCKSIPIQSLVNYVKKGVVFIDELQKAGLNEEKMDALITALKDEDESLWANAVNENNVSSYRNYLNIFQSGSHVSEALEKIESLDRECWKKVQENLTEENLKQYLTLFPDGLFASECNDFLDDLPWLETKKKNTIADYESYKSQYPGKHSKEISDAINILNDEKEWDNAIAVGTTKAYQRYIELHPHGNFVSEARNKIQASAGKESFLRRLKADPNAFDALTIKNKIKNISDLEKEVAEILGEEQKDAILKYEKPADLPGNNDPDSLSKKLEDDSTEVYFWGYRGSGKTCALGSVISSLRKKGNLEKLPCKGFDYMTRLSNIFTTENICILPPGTENANIQEMIMNVRSEDKEKHKITLIDLAGELIEIAYAKNHNDSSFVFYDDDYKSLDKALDYLKDDRNNKIHFFVVEYDSHTKQVGPNGEYTVEDLLDNMITLLRTNNVFKKSTVGVYILITKSDKIDSEENRPTIAGEYFEENFPMFCTNIIDACDDAKIRDLRTIAFSVGEVFAQNLCLFDDKYTKKVVDKFIIKTYGEGSSLFDKLKKFLRSY